MDLDSIERMTNSHNTNSSEASSNHYPVLARPSMSVVFPRRVDENDYRSAIILLVKDDDVNYKLKMKRDIVGTVLSNDPQYKQSSMVYACNCIGHHTDLLNPISLKTEKDAFQSVLEKDLAVWGFLVS